MASRIDKDARSEAAKHHALAITTRELKQMDEGDDMKITTESIQNDCQSIQPKPTRSGNFLTFFWPSCTIVLADLTEKLKTNSADVISAQKVSGRSRLILHYCST